METTTALWQFFVSFIVTFATSREKMAALVYVVIVLLILITGVTAFQIVSKLRKIASWLKEVNLKRPRGAWRRLTFNQRLGFIGALVGILGLGVFDQIVTRKFHLFRNFFLHFRNFSDLFSVDRWLAFGSEEWRILTIGVALLYMFSAFYKDSQRQIEFLEILFSPNRAPDHANETNKVLFLFPFAICLFLVIFSFSDNVTALVLALLALYVYSYFAHRMWWSRLRADIDNPAYTPDNNDIDAQTILDRRIIIRAFMGKTRIYVKEGIVSSAFLIVVILLACRYLGLLRFDDNIVYVQIITIITVNEATIFTWRVIRDYKLNKLKTISKSVVMYNANNDIHMTGVYRVLQVIPIWSVALGVLVGGPCAIFVGRLYFEGIPYQVSSAAAIGDIGLLVCVLIGVTAFQRKTANFQEWILSGRRQAMFVAMCVIIGLLVLSLRILSHQSPVQITDAYHDVIVVPFYLLCWITLAPIINAKGTQSEKGIAIIIIFVWALLAISDYHSGRLDQRAWLANKGLIFAN